MVVASECTLSSCVRRSGPTAGQSVEELGKLVLKSAPKLAKFFVRVRKSECVRVCKVEKTSHFPLVVHFPSRSREVSKRER